MSDGIPRIKPDILTTLREWAAFEQDGGNVEQGAAIDMMLDWYDRWSAREALSRPEPVAVKVKKLEWNWPEGSGWITAQTPFGPRKINVNNGIRNDETGEYYNSVDDAKDALQAEHDKNVRACLSASPSPPASEQELLDLLNDYIDARLAVRRSNRQTYLAAEETVRNIWAVILKRFGIRALSGNTNTP
jgi:hypothetical protein